MSHKQGILLVDKTSGSTSFHIVSLLRRLTGIEKIGHAGTLDPFATGVMVMLVGKAFTTRSNEFLQSEKEYRATLRLGITTDTYDLEGQVIQRSDYIPPLEEIEKILPAFQGTVSQTPPMFSAKKVQGKKLYELARKGIEIERAPVLVEMHIQILRYEYPELEIQVRCSKGTYIRSLAYDLGAALQCGAHLSGLVRLRSGAFKLENCISQNLLKTNDFNISPHLLESL